MAAEWDTMLEEYLIQNKQCYAAALGNVEDCGLYAAAPVKSGKGWAYVHAEEQPRKIVVDEEGGAKKVMINEAATLKECLARDLAKKGPSKTGLWLGGRKYRVVTRDPAFEVNQKKMIVVSAAAENKKGVQICATKTSVVLGFYDENKGQNKADARNAVVDFAAYMQSQGL